MKILLIILLLDTAKYKKGDTVYQINWKKHYVIDLVQIRRHRYFYRGHELERKNWEYLGESVIKKSHYEKTIKQPMELLLIWSRSNSNNLLGIDSNIWRRSKSNH